MTRKNGPVFWNNIFLLIYCTFLFVYVFIRAFHLSFTIDEVTTVNIALSENWMNLTATANNHFLNTLLIKGSLALFEPSEIAYRLPNVLSFIVYLVYAIKLSQVLRPKAPYLVIILLTAMPFLLDFFSLARGYGLSLAFVLPSVYYLLHYVKENSFTSALIALLMGMLAVLSNFSTLNFFIPLLLILFFFSVNKRNRNWMNVIVLFSLAGIFLWIILPILFELKSNEQLYFGGRGSFYSDTILSLSRTLSYHTLNIGFAKVVFTILFAVGGAISIFSIYKMLRKKAFEMNDVLPLFFLLSILSPLIHNLIFDTYYPVERAALIYYLLLVLLLVNDVPEISRSIQIRLLKPISFSFLAFLLLALNFNHSYSWRYDAGTKEVFEILAEKTNSDSVNQPVSLGVNGLVAHSTFFYQEMKRIDSLSLNEIYFYCDYDLALEEFDLHYYADSVFGETTLCEKDARRIATSGFDYYYLLDCVVDELIRHGYEVNIIRHLAYAGSSLITIENKALIVD